MSAPAKSLLDRARAVPVLRGGYTVDDEILEAAVAWLKGEVRGAQLATVWGIKQNAVSTKMLGELRNAAQQGRLKLEILP